MIIQNAGQILPFIPRVIPFLEEQAADSHTFSILQSAPNAQRNAGIARRIRPACGMRLLTVPTLATSMGVRGIEEMVGVCINAVARRVIFDLAASVIDMLQESASRNGQTRVHWLVTYYETLELTTFTTKAI